MKKEKRFEMRLDKQTQMQLARLAKVTNASKGEVVRRLILQAEYPPYTERRADERSN